MISASEPFRAIGLYGGRVVASPRPLDPFVGNRTHTGCEVVFVGCRETRKWSYVCSSGSPKQWVRQTAGVVFESIRRIARRQVHGVVLFDTDGSEARVVRVACQK